jgi:hypothetical protein
MGSAWEVARDGYMGQEELHTSLSSEDVSQITCIIEEWHET